LNSILRKIRLLEICYILSYSNNI